MKYNHKIIATAMLAISVLARSALAECVIVEETKQLDPVEVGFCEADAVFVGKVDQRLETVRAYREENSDRTTHFRIESSTARVLKRYKGTPPDKVTMIADLYVKKAAYSFELGKEYLVFAKRLAGENEYAGASAACSVQTSLPIEAAANAIKQLEEHAKGRKKIDCKSIRLKEISKP